MKHLKLIFAVFLLWILSFGCNKDDDPTPTGLQPGISGVSPSEGAISTELAIIGTNFEPGAAVIVGGVNSTVVDVTSATSIFAQVPSGVVANTLLSVSVRNLAGKEATFENAFTAIPPELEFVNSATKPSGNVGSTVILEGKAFGSVQGTSKIYFSDGAGSTIEASVSNPDDWTDQFIITTVPSGADDGPLYIETELGASNEMIFNVTEAATFSPSTINWTSTTALPVAVSGHYAQFVTINDASDVSHQFVYVTGGRNDTPEALDQAIYGEINADGTIAEWKSATSLPTPLAFHSTVAATPYNSKVSGSGHLYTIGGVDGDSNVVNRVSVAPFNNDGSLSSWSGTTSLPEPLHSHGAVIFRNTIYVAGGATTGDVPVNKVYKSVIDTTGALGDWQELSAMPFEMTYHSFVNFGAYLYAVGGENGISTPDAGTSSTNLSQVIFARLDLRTGNITDAGWKVNENELQKSRSKHTTLTAGGNLFVSSGLYSAAGQGSSENTYAQILADGTIGTFAGATGSNTLLSQGGYNLYNQAGISYVDANGLSRVMILGGASVNDPNVKTSNVLFY
jgi:hypothetical protein